MDKLNERFFSKKRINSFGFQVFFRKTSREYSWILYDVKTKQ